MNDWIIRPFDRVLVTGAAGFVGTKLVQTLLSYGFTNLCCFVRPMSKTQRMESIVAGFKDANVDIVRGNLVAHDDCRKIVKNASVIYHLAAGVSKSYPDCFLNSVVGTRNLLDAIIDEGKLKRFVNISSIAVYSNEKIRRGGVMDESCALDDRLLERAEPYTYGKAKQDELVLDYVKRRGLPCVTIRPSVVFGPGKAAMTSRIGTDTFGLFLHLGLGNRIPLTYVDNCAEAVVLAGLKPGIEGETINVVDDDLPRSRQFLKLYKSRVGRFFSLPVPYSAWYGINWLWEKYSLWSGGQLPLTFNRRKCTTYWKGNMYPNRKAKELLGWQPRVPMDKAMEEFFAYVREGKGK